MSDRRSGDWIPIGASIIVPLVVLVGGWFALVRESPEDSKIYRELENRMIVQEIESKHQAEQIKELLEYKAEAQDRWYDQQETNRRVHDKLFTWSSPKGERP